MLFKNLFEKLGLKPMANLIAGEKGIMSAIVEKNDPNGKISSRRGAAMVLIGAAVTMAASINYDNTLQVITMLSFALLGVILLVVASFNYKKPGSSQS